MPRTISSCSLVSSRQTATGRAGSSCGEHRQATPRRGAGDSNATSVSGAANAASSPDRLRGRKPAKRHASDGSPLATSAVSAEDGPGSTSTATPAATQPWTSGKPGSETSGIPASLTSATTSPPSIRSTSSAARGRSLCSW